MKITQKHYQEGSFTGLDEADLPEAQLVLAFGGREAVSNASFYDDLRTQYKDANIILCSTAGEILGTDVYDDSVAVTAIAFENTPLAFAKADIEKAEQSEEIGTALAKELPQEDLQHVLVFSDGLLVNGTKLTRGLSSNLPDGVSVTGGLVGDGSNFEKTVVGLDEVPSSGNIVVVGMYGSACKIGYGSLGGWDPFGPERLITKSEGNVLYELDHKPALALYKEYLGDKADELPSSGLLFPLTLRTENQAGQEIEVVRTILAVDEEAQSMTFAGDIPEGAHAKLMKVNFDRLVDGASGAAEMSQETLSGSKPELALLISCIGRKLVLKGRIEEEVEAVQNMLGKSCALTGFYSYGELCPVAATEKQCELHNQTMTITTFREEV